jgi:hypothetical protein
LCPHKSLAGRYETSPHKKKKIQKYLFIHQHSTMINHSDATGIEASFLKEINGQDVVHHYF